MSIEPQIKHCIATLNYTWFQQLKNEFEQHPFYNKNNFSIDASYQDYFHGYDFRTDEEVEEIEDVVIQASLYEYAWKGEDYPYEVEEDRLVFKADNLVTKFTSIIDPLLLHIVDIKDKYILIVSVLKFIAEQVEELKHGVDDRTYYDTIDYCLQQFQIEISKKYQLIKRAHDTIVEYEDKLLFDTSQKELAFLLAVFIRAGFIHGASAKNSTVTSFFAKYFYFQNQKAGKRFKRATDIGKKISDVYSLNNTDYVKIREEMKDRLIKAIKEL